MITMRSSRSILVIMIALGIVIAPVGEALARKFGIVTGSNTGTYIKIGQDIAKLLRRHRITLNVHTSQGSLENIYSVLNYPRRKWG